MSDQAVSHRRSSGIARLMRGWTVALLVVVLAAGGHQTAHSIIHGATETIPLQLLLISGALTAPIAVALTSRGVSNWSTAVTTIFGQIVFHLLYSLPYTGVSDVPNAHDHHGQMIPVAVREATTVEQAGHSMAAADTVMIAAHLLAAVLTTVVVVHGERSLLTLAHWLTLRPVRIVLATRSVTLARPKAILSAVRVWIPHPMNVTQTRSSRGPPVLA